MAKLDRAAPVFRAERQAIMAEWVLVLEQAQDLAQAARPVEELERGQDLGHRLHRTSIFI